MSLDRKHVHRLADFANVDLSSAQDGDGLQYSATTGMWTAQQLERWHHVGTLNWSGLLINDYIDHPMVVSPSGDLKILNGQNIVETPALLTYQAGTTGNVPPLHTLTGTNFWSYINSSFGFSYQGDLAAADDNVWVTARGEYRLYPTSAGSGDLAALQSHDTTLNPYTGGRWAGAATDKYGPLGPNLYVGSFSNWTVMVYDALSVNTPSRYITWFTTFLPFYRPIDIAVTPYGWLYALVVGGELSNYFAILEFPPGAGSATFGTDSIPTRVVDVGVYPYPTGIYYDRLLDVVFVSTHSDRIGISGPGKLIGYPRVSLIHDPTYDLNTPWTASNALDNGYAYFLSGSGPPYTQVEVYHWS